MTRYGPMFGPDVTFLGVDRCDLDDPASYAGADVVIVGAPFDGGTSYRPGARFGPQAIRTTDYLAARRLAPAPGAAHRRPAGPAGRRRRRRRDVLRRRRASRPARARGGGARRSPSPARSRSSSAATTPSPGPTSPAWRTPLGWGRVSVLHFDAHADTGDVEFGSLIGHGQPMRRLIESGAARGDRFLQIGLRGYWPPPRRLRLDGRAGHALLRDDRDRAPRAGRRASPRRSRSPPTTATASSCRSTSTSATPVTRRAPAPPSPAGCPRASCSTRCAGSASSCRSSASTSSRSSPALRPRRHHRRARQPGRARGAVRRSPAGARTPASGTPWDAVAAAARRALTARLRQRGTYLALGTSSGGRLERPRRGRTAGSIGDGRMSSRTPPSTIDADADEERRRRSPSAGRRACSRS